MPGTGQDEVAAFDAAVRQAAFDRVRELARGGELTGGAILAGFDFGGERWPLVNPQRGIFKPRRLPYLLSIRTVIPRKGGRARYDDQVRAHGQIFAGSEVLDYAFMGDDPGAPENVRLRGRRSARRRSATSWAWRPAWTGPSSPPSSSAGTRPPCAPGSRSARWRARARRRLRRTRPSGATRRG